MRRWIGFLGSWALLVLALGLASFAIAGEVINTRDSKRLDRVAVVDQLIAERSGNKAGVLRQNAERRQTEVTQMKLKVLEVTKQTDEVADTGQTIMVSTAENKVYVRRDGQTIFEARCSTGKGTKLAVDGKTLVFDTPIGKFHIKSKEENPVWVPPDWHFIEEARKNGMRVVRLGPGSSIDADTGDAPVKRDEGVWSWFGGSTTGSSRVLRMRGNTVVEDSGGYERELPPGKTIIAGNTIVIPPVGTPQRTYDKVLGHFRLNLGDGYALHGTQATEDLGRSVSHGCVRLGDADIERLFQMASVGDEVIIY